MGFFSQSIEKKKEKEIRHASKEQWKCLVQAGMNQTSAKAYIECLGKTLLLAYLQKDSYASSKNSMKEMELILLELLSDFSSADRNRILSALTELVKHMEKVYHACTIRQDDMDFASTCSYIKKMESNYVEEQRLMLQSELENLLHVIEETKEWEAPDFMALAYFCQYENPTQLAEMENVQRNEMILAYYREHFLHAFFAELDRIGERARVQKWIEEVLE